MDEWERAWQRHWRRTGFTPYELPADGSTAQQERRFLMQSRTVERERDRLKRIVAEFEHGFRRLYKLGPSVTVFGSARFKPDSSIL